MDKHRVRGHFRNGKWVRSYTRRNRGGGGGGGDPGPANPAGGALIVGTLVFGGIAVVLGAIGVTSLKLSTTSRPKSAEKAFSIDAKSGFNHASAMLTAHGFKVRLESKLGTNCTLYSYGQVHTFFESHRCNYLARAYIQIGEPDQGLILVAISWVAMPNESSAKAYRKLADTPGSGAITELSKEVKLYKNIKYANSAHVSGINGPNVWNVQVNPVFPTTVDAVNKILSDSRQ